MFDDGLHGDGAAGDGLFAGQISNRPNNTVVEYYVEASDGTFTRSYPNVVPGPAGQTANLLYQVNDAIDPSAAWTPGSAPNFMFVMTNYERSQLDQLGNNSPNSNAQMNGT